MAADLLSEFDDDAVVDETANGGESWRASGAGLTNTSIRSLLQTALNIRRRGRRLVLLNNKALANWQIAWRRAGAFVASAGVEANYTVTLKWKKE